MTEQPTDPTAPDVTTEAVNDDPQAAQPGAAADDLHLAAAGEDGHLVGRRLDVVVEEDPQGEQDHDHRGTCRDQDRYGH